MDAHASLPKFREFLNQCQELPCGEDRATLESDLSALQGIGRRAASIVSDVALFFLSGRFDADPVPSLPMSLSDKLNVEDAP